ncbi:metal-dependent hydrolase [Methanolobus sp. ZRKC3]|uniref:metal-dependent hydrolase n=1 Tax=Methanolobus sp. ZRKC3 TaxID=3125786 RepID=UPI0032451DD4
MVNTLSHLGIGLLIASFAGLEGRQKKIVAFFAILPDLDFLATALFTLIDGRLTHQMHNLLFYFLGHREFMHSILFTLLVILGLWYYQRDRKLTLVAGAAIFLHLYLDYATSWKMRPLFPLDTGSSIMGSIFFFDPVVTIISFIPIYFLLLDQLRKKRKNGNLRNEVKKELNDAGQKRVKLNKALLIVFVLWCVLTPFSKALLVNHISEIEGHDISYQNSYPISPGVFLSAYSYNQTHYKILESNYWSGIEQAIFIPKVVTDGSGEDSPYVQRAKRLYDASLPKEIDYVVYNVSTNENNVTVTLSDARTSYVRYWAYFKTDYIFVFNRDNEDYSPYIRRQMGNEELVAKNWFE